MADPGSIEYSAGGEIRGNNSGVLEMRGVAFAVLFGIVACATGDTVTPANAFSELRGWRTSDGRLPSKNEFAAVVAACEDRAKTANKNDPIDGCLADYGLRRGQ